MTKSLVIAYVALFFISFAHTVFSDNKLSDVVHTTYGNIKGSITPTGLVFLGIPFAAPPVGPLRWKEPIPPTPWTGTLSTQAYGPSCTQPNDPSSQEDCLYLNVYVPTNATPDKKLPVMHFFYGGCWETGSSSNALYNASNVLSLTQNLIIVTSNYRLGPFGFLASKQLAAESPTKTTGNYGLLDQRLALQWVSANIENFGGDPKKVTIYGESAGSASISDHLVMVKSWGLFRGAIMESGPIVSWSARDLSGALKQFDIFAASLQCGMSDPAQQIACLRSIPTDEVEKYSRSYCDPLVTCCWSPTIDGSEITESPQVLASQGKFYKVPILLGTNLNEGSIFTKVPFTLTPAQYAQDILQSYGNDLGSKILQQYPASDFTSPWYALSFIFRDQFMTCPARRTARWFSPYVDVYLYFFTHPIESIIKIDPYIGVFHGSELGFVFNVPDGIYSGLPFFFTEQETHLQSEFVSYWTNFGISLNPNSEITTFWPKYNQTSDVNLNLNVIPTVESGLLDSKCNFWDSVNGV
eukprot:TRINITY_DN11986_c0_g1_i1.p1 TRINITY_DN11986_c0_g1~~TRINITY_DN11986_c0_g1_i1.p1  ORF type:complete len:525 (-),score=65.73 TRINITY_DN11986_c0_g1_i1:51-1625(-)